jgi:multimeric flavodoxin WrbA
VKVIAFNGSGRKDGNTAILIRQVFKELEKEGIETELVQLAGQDIHGCRACYKCFSTKDKRCVQNDDIVNESIAKMEKADGIILASPTYFADCSGQMKAFIDRTGLVAKSNGILKRKVAVRRAGAIHAFDSLNHFFTIAEMIIVGSSYWNVGIGREPGQVEKDEEGMSTMAVLGQNMAWLLKKVAK